MGCCQSKEAAPDAESSKSASQSSASSPPLNVLTSDSGVPDQHLESPIADSGRDLHLLQPDDSPLPPSTQATGLRRAVNPSGVTISLSHENASHNQRRASESASNYQIQINSAGCAAFGCTPSALRGAVSWMVDKMLPDSSSPQKSLMTMEDFFSQCMIPFAQKHMKRRASGSDFKCFLEMLWAHFGTQCGSSAPLEDVGPATNVAVLPWGLPVFDALDCLIAHEDSKAAGESSSQPSRYYWIDSFSLRCSDQIWNVQLKTDGSLPDIPLSDKNDPVDWLALEAIAALPHTICLPTLQMVEVVKDEWCRALLSAHARCAPPDLSPLSSLDFAMNRKRYPHPFQALGSNFGRVWLPWTECCKEDAAPSGTSCRIVRRGVSKSPSQASSLSPAPSGLRHLRYRSDHVMHDRSTTRMVTLSFVDLAQSATEGSLFGAQARVDLMENLGRALLAAGDVQAGAGWLHQVMAASSSMDEDQKLGIEQDISRSYMTAGFADNAVQMLESLVQRSVSKHGILSSQTLVLRRNLCVANMMAGFPEKAAIVGGHVIDNIEGTQECSPLKCLVILAHLFSKDGLEQVIRITDDLPVCKPPYELPTSQESEAIFCIAARATCLLRVRSFQQAADCLEALHVHISGMKKESAWHFTEEEIDDTDVFPIQLSQFVFQFPKVLEVQMDQAISWAGMRKRDQAKALLMTACETALQANDHAAALQASIICLRMNFNADSVSKLQTLLDILPDSSSNLKENDSNDQESSEETELGATSRDSNDISCTYCGWMATNSKSRIEWLTAKVALGIAYCQNGQYNSCSDVLLPIAAQMPFLNIVESDAESECPDEQMDKSATQSQIGIHGGDSERSDQLSAMADRTGDAPSNGLDHGISFSTCPACCRAAEAWLWNMLCQILQSTSVGAIASDQHFSTSKRGHQLEATQNSPPVLFGQDDDQARCHSIDKAMDIASHNLHRFTERSSKMKTIPMPLQTKINRDHMAPSVFQSAWASLGLIAEPEVASLCKALWHSSMSGDLELGMRMLENARMTLRKRREDDSFIALQADLHMGHMQRMMGMFEESEGSWWQAAGRASSLFGEDCDFVLDLKTEIAKLMLVQCCDEGIATNLLREAHYGFKNKGGSAAARYNTVVSLARQLLQQAQAGVQRSDSTATEAVQLMGDWLDQANDEGGLETRLDLVKNMLSKARGLLE